MMSLGKPSCNWRLPGSFVKTEDAVELLVSSCYYGFEEASNSFRWSGGGPSGRACGPSGSSVSEQVKAD